MQIADLTKYSNTTSSSEAMNGTRGVEKLVSTVRDMAAGNIFEGTVNSVQNGKVVLGLSNGTELMARLDANMQLVRGQSMFFQVKSNNGETIAIRPYTIDGAGVNLTLLNALKAASLPVTEKYLNMANSMMQEQMPIDKNSMAQMARILMANPDMSVNTLVQMKKLNIPITTEMVAQFENYVDDTSAVHKALDSFISELPSTMAGKDMPLEQLKAFDSQLLQVLAEGLDEMQASGQSVASEQTTISASATSETMTLSQVVEGATAEIKAANEQAVNVQTTNVQTANAEAINVETANMETINVEAANTEVANIEATNVEAANTEVANIEATNIEAANIETANIENTNTENTNAQTANEQNVATAKETLQSQEQVLRLLDSLFGDTGITKDDSATVLLQKLSAFLLNGQNVSKENLTQLFASKDMRTFLRDVIEQQMYLSPEEVADTEKVKKLYERLESKTQNLHNLLQSAGLNETPLAQTIQNVHGNIEFMNQLNANFTYMQIPLKMSGQNASGQLYVYTKKRDLNDPDKDLTAFLHLDLEHLGSTDVSVRLHKKDVDTKFYMDSDESYDLVKKYMPQLEERLKLKGYNCKIYVENEGKKVNFVEDFLKKDAPSTGQLHRYSFDVRA